MNRYVVQLPLPAGDGADLADAGERARVAAEQLTREGVAVRWVCSVFVPEAESCLFVFEAPTEAAVERPGRRAGLAYRRITQGEPPDMIVDPKTLSLPVILTPAIAAGGDADRTARAAAGAPTASAPLAIALTPKHRSGVTGTATFTPAGANLMVTLTLDQRVAGTLMAHIVTAAGPSPGAPIKGNVVAYHGMSGAALEFERIAEEKDPA